MVCAVAMTCIIVSLSASLISSTFECRTSTQGVVEVLRNHALELIEVELGVSLPESGILF